MRYRIVVYSWLNAINAAKMWKCLSDATIVEAIFVQNIAFQSSMTARGSIANQRPLLTPDHPQEPTMNIFPDRADLEIDSISARRN